MGFASVSGHGVTQTKGGLGGETVFADRHDELQQYLESPDPLTVVVCGEITLPERLRVGSNKTLLGLGPTSILRGGIDVMGTEEAPVADVIISNLVLDASAVESSSQATEMSGIRVAGAHHVWLDRLEVYDAPLGLVDVIWGADLVTLSWNNFYFTPSPPDVVRRFGIRIGDHETDTKPEQNAGRLRVTLHHNWFNDFIRQRSPRTAHGAQVHLFNNYYSVESTDANPDDHSTIWATGNAQVRLESNYFRNTTNPHEVRESTASLVAHGNVYYATSGHRGTNGDVFTPPYSYTKDSTVWLPSLVPWGAGPHLDLGPEPPWSDAGTTPPDEATTEDDTTEPSSPGTDAIFDAGVGDASVDELDATGL